MLYCDSFGISLFLIKNGPDNKSTVLVMAWRRTGDKPLPDQLTYWQMSTWNTPGLKC